MAQRTASVRFGRYLAELPPMTGRSRRDLIIAALAIAPLASAIGQPPSAAPSFAIRVDPSSAAKVDRVLAAIAEPVSVTLREGQLAQDYLRGLCGDRAPSLLPASPETAGPDALRTIRFLPCVRQQTDVRIKARTGDTLEAIAVRLGLRLAAASTLHIVAADGVSRSGDAPLMPGDTVIAPAVPVWTPFTVRPDTVATREALVAALSTAIGCAPASEDKCLQPRGILVLEQPPPASGSLPDPASDAGAAPLPPSPPSLTAAPSPPPAPPAATDAGASPPAFTFPASLTAADLSAAKVAPEQWPYDRPLVAAILKGAGERGRLTDFVIGVGDNGLADAVGAPLPPASFVDAREQPPLEAGPPNSFDDDGNGVVDDIIGAGIRRDLNDELPTGDVALCPNVAEAVAGWSGATREQMSHGAVVASIASGLPLRTGDARIDAILPKIVFFRLFRNACTDGNDDYDQAANEAINFLNAIDVKDKIINLSSFVDGHGGILLKNRIEGLVRSGPTPLLVVPAGDSPINLDERRPCPPCLAKLTSGPISRGILAVGAATRDLRPADYTGLGYGTVRLFAPGEPVGAVDIGGASADSFAPVTSYATPLVSLAAALIGAQGVGDRLRNRLLLSTWPLYDENGLVGSAGGPIDVGVLDLVKAAAIRYDVVEVIERRADDELVRHTYVGDITAGLDGLGTGTLVNRQNAMGLRLGAVQTSGFRLATIFTRRIDSETLEPVFDPLPAKPVGNLSLRLIDGTHTTLPWAAVTQLLLRKP